MRKMHTLSGPGRPVLDEADRLVFQRFVALQYEDDGSGDDGGSGSALDSITAAATSLGASYVASQLSPTTVNPPTVVKPPAATGALTGSSSMLWIVGLLILGVGAFFFVSRA